jgi:photosystem II stability/assembly factor-like uncharacterized protein
MPRATRRPVLLALGALAAVLLGTGPARPLEAGEAPAAAGWQAAGWGGGGFYWSCAFHPAKDGVIYLGGDVNGVYRSDDHGQRWRMCNCGLGNYAIYSLAVDAKHPDTVYAGTPEGVWRSDDGGEHWLGLPTTAPKQQAVIAERNDSVRALCVDPASGTVFAGTPRGKVLVSSDQGATWKQLYELPAKGAISAVAVSPRDGRRLLAASTTAGLLLSVDGGATWTALATPKLVRHAAFAPADDQVVYAACGKDGVWRSADLGATWTRAGSGLDPKSDLREVVIDAKDARRAVAIGNEGWGGSVYRTDDGGATWTRIRGLAADLKHDPTLPEEAPGGHAGLSTVTNLAVDPRNGDELYLAANWRCAHSSDGGRTWEERDHGADITCITDIRFQGGKTYVSAMDEGLLVSDDHGGSWRQLLPRKYTGGLSGHHWRIHLAARAEGGVRLVSTCSPWDTPVNQVEVSDDGGATFATCRQGLPAQRPSLGTMWGQGYARALASDPSDPLRLYLGIDGDPEPAKHIDGGGVFTSADGGRSWTRLAGQPASRQVFYGLAVDPGEPRRLYWGACGAAGGVYRSDDRGVTWTKVFSQESYVFNLAVSASGVLYCTGNELWRSDDHGATWKKLTSLGGDGTAVVGLELHPSDERTLWISRVAWSDSAHGGVYGSRDGGATWQDLTGDLPHRKPLVLRYDAAAGELWAGNVGLYKLAQ